MKEKIVLDSSTVILLAKINLLNLIANETELLCPEEVAQESTRKNNFDAKLIKKLIEENKIGIEKADKKKTEKLMKDFNIEKGEAEALEIAKRKNMLIATDDGPTIKACRIMEIRFATAIHFIVRSYEKKILKKSIALEKLKMLERYGRYNYDLIKDAKNKLGG